MKLIASIGRCCPLHDVLILDARLPGEDGPVPWTRSPIGYEGMMTRGARGAVTAMKEVLARGAYDTETKVQVEFQNGSADDHRDFRDALHLLLYLLKTSGDALAQMTTDGPPLPESAHTPGDVWH